jgi:vancomycin permeability regulator SanA
MASSRKSRKASRTPAKPRGIGAFLEVAFLRGVALFFGLYSLANGLAAWRSPAPSQDIWWIDLSVLPNWMGVTLGLACAFALIAFAALPRMARWRRFATVGACGVLGSVAVLNTASFYGLWNAKRFAPSVPVPLSLLIAAAFAWLAWRVSSLDPAKHRSLAGELAVLAAALLVAALFPLAQVAFFGTTDYRAKADAAVVFGAKVNADRSLSVSTFDRMTTAVGLYRSGLVRTLVLSGGTGQTGVDEPGAMADFAVAHGIPSSAILLDHDGVDTDATVRNTLAIFRAGGIRRVLAVSQGYHLPRVKLAYLSAGFDVRTVPAGTSQPIVQTPLYIVREIPAFWLYWTRATAGDIIHG